VPPARLALGLGTALLLGGCFGNAEAPRLVHPELGPAPSVATVGTDRQALRLRPVRASSLLEARIVWRSSAVEVGYYEQERWTDPPATYVERALERELFQRRGWLRTEEPSAPWSLDIDVRSFEEVLLPEHAVRIVLSVTLEDDAQRARLLREVEVVRAVGEDGLEPMAKAMGGALVDAAARVGDLVASAAPPDAAPPR
jgi:ABC-type uncharacterized transport system auxiliary subunit